MSFRVLAIEEEEDADDEADASRTDAARLRFVATMSEGEPSRSEEVAKGVRGAKSNDEGR